MSEGVLNEAEAGDRGRTEAEDRLLGRLDYALRGLRGPGALAPSPLGASRPQGVLAAAESPDPVERHALTPAEEREVIVQHHVACRLALRLRHFQLLAPPLRR